MTADGALHAFAARPERSRGRVHPQPADGRGRTRDAFSRDRDRIVHSVSFRRLRHKTQVFVAPDGDHVRVRLTHTLEVAQIGRTIARALGLNEDLTEALCLAHDLGHPPFGHAGEAALDRALAEHGGFDHNGQTLRTVTRLERRYPDWPGLNLSWETLEGLAKHNGPQPDPGWALAEADRASALALDRWPTLEAQVAALADDIAYDNHDIDDGLRAGLLTPELLLTVPLIRASHDRVRARRPDLPAEWLWPEVIRQQIGVMVDDLIATTLERANGLSSVEEVRDAGRATAAFSPRLAEEERVLKRFLYASLYHHPHQLSIADTAGRIVSALHGTYTDDPRRMEPGWANTLPAEEPARARHIADYIAGMTDRFAVREHRRHVGMVELPVEL